MRKGRRVTIREVAQAAGVSTQTVSRVLNDRPDVAPETYERVQQVIARTGYSPNLMARGLTQGRTHSLGVVVYGLEYFGPSRILTGIEQQAAAMGYSMSLTLIHEPGTRDVDDVLAKLVGRQVDGVIWAIPEVGHNREWVRSRGYDMPVPLVLVGGAAIEEGLPSIRIDNAAMGRLATRHLLKGGARRPAIVTGPLEWWESQQRLLGWQATLREAGQEPLERMVFHGDWTATSGEQGLYELLRRSPDVDAVFASNDQMALGVLHAAHRLGLRVPDDLSVAGVDDIAEGSHYWPPLTTVHQPLGEAGALAVTTIDEAIRSARQRGRSEVASTDGVSPLQPELIIRQSSQPLPTA